ncbi:MAG: PilZ domain-containing protein [Spirochaetales bacterium]|nr:PilZ domain-containing protein [Spirochaetales bacterium]
MKLLLVTSKEDTRAVVFKHFAKLGYDFISYNNPLKAMDNLSEISPDVVLFNAEDFPRHWKPFLQVMRQLSKRDKSVFVILKGDSFNNEEALKAGSLAVNGVISENFDSEEELIQLEHILSRYIVHNDLRGPRRFTRGMYDDVEFLFNHPVNLTMLTGTVSDLSFDGLKFKPDCPHLTSNIKEGTNIPACSIRFGDFVCSVGVRVVRNNKSISFRFSDFDEADRDCFIDYLDSLVYNYQPDTDSQNAV